MSKPSIQSINLKLEKHIAVSDEKFSELLSKVKRIETIMIGTSGTALVMLIGLLVR
tara:strand:- start:65 stop:232 length:168 start_codon:yes stop_codon:yes gene_type:complete